MPRLEELEEHNGRRPQLADAEAGHHDSSFEEFRRRASTAWDSFTNFALRDNVLEVAVGLIFASSFTALANSLVTDIILPVISLLPFISRNLDQRFTVLRKGPNYYHPEDSNEADDLVSAFSTKLKRGAGGATPISAFAPSTTAGYNTKDQALSDGAVIWAWGSFLDKFLRFFLIAVSLWLIARIYGLCSHDNIIKRQVKCRYCRKYISEKAKRCVNCTSWLDGREEDKMQGGLRGQGQSS